MIVKKYIMYAGIDQPATPEQIKVELCGLKNVIKIAEELMSRLDQALAIYELKLKEKDGYG